MGWVTIGFPCPRRCNLRAWATSSPRVACLRFTPSMPWHPFVLCVLVAIFVRDYPEQAGAYPDNNHKFDSEAARSC